MKRSALWIALVLLSAAAVPFAWRYFGRAFPIVTLDLRMDRQGAIDRARQIAAAERLGPSEYRDAASFSLDETVQSFVELEGGGKSAFMALVGDPLFSPYRWRVRHFREQEPNETTFAFAADGTAAGFVEKLREDAPGAALDADAARRIGETAAADRWHVALTSFHPVEQAQERRPGGRVDHTFVYERPDAALGEGRYRLRLVVGGDRLTEVTYFVRIPEAFTRRYEHMRSANLAIGIGATLAMFVLYIAVGAGVGLFFLMRRRWVLWRQPLFWGALVAIAQTLATLNGWPLAWMDYDTALSTQSFLARQAALLVLELVVNLALFTLSFMAAESLTRRAFPRHPQLWRAWGAEAGASREVAARTAVGYLFVPLFIAYDVALYLFATRSLGWWTPSEALFNPDVLAHYAPWFTAVARSWQAGFWEESLFRAVPIAGAALIGDRIGKRRLCIVIAFVVQAVIFGGGHAPYPTQPAYARPVELVIPSIGFGLLYLWFGLLPGIVLHFTFDTFWFAIPLFASSAPGVRTQQALVVLAALTPLWIVLVRRARAGAWLALPERLRNGGWQPAEAAEAPAEAAAPAQTSVAASAIRAIVIAGAVAAVAWIALAIALPIERQPLHVGRADAVAAARQAIAPSPPGEGWRFHAAADDGASDPHRFVWRTAGRSTYAGLVGSYLDAPGWTVLVRRFEGDVAERRESWTVRVDRDGRVARVTHDLPEARAGAALDADAARALAVRTIHDRFGLDGSALREVSAAPSKLPNRTDWTITEQDLTKPLPQGEARLSVRIAGGEVADVSRFVHVPEEWERAERNRDTALAILQGAAGVLGGLALLAGVVGAVVSWSRRRFRVALFGAVAAAFLVVGFTNLFNGFPGRLTGLSTAQPLPLQIAILLGAGAVGAVLTALAAGLVDGAAPVWSPWRGVQDPASAIRLGAAAGAIGAAARVLGSAIGSGAAPSWPSYAGASAFAPVLASAVAPASAMLFRTTFALLLAAAATLVTHGWTRRRAMASVALVVVAGMLGAASPQSLAAWIASAVIVGATFLLLYVLVLRHDISVIPIAIATMTAAGALREGSLGAYAGSPIGSIVGAAIVLAIGFVWFRALRNSSFSIRHS